MKTSISSLKGASAHSDGPHRGERNEDDHKPLRETLFADNGPHVVGVQRIIVIACRQLCTRCLVT